MCPEISPNGFHRTPDTVLAFFSPLLPARTSVLVTVLMAKDGNEVPTRSCHPAKEHRTQLANSVIDSACEMYASIIF